MSNGIQTWQVIALAAGILGVIGLGVGASMAIPDAEDLPGELTKQRTRLQKFFTVAEDCSLIEFEGETAQFHDALRSYLAEAVPVARAQGVSSPEKEAEFALQLLFPQCVWPPPDGFERPDLALLLLVTTNFVKDVPA